MGGVTFTEAASEGASHLRSYERMRRCEVLRIQVIGRGNIGRLE